MGGMRPYAQCQLSCGAALLGRRAWLVGLVVRSSLGDAPTGTPDGCQSPCVCVYVCECVVVSVLMLSKRSFARARKIKILMELRFDMPWCMIRCMIFFLQSMQYCMRMHICRTDPCQGFVASPHFHFATAPPIL